MTEQQHTPGPWRLAGFDDQNRRVVADCQGNNVAYIAEFGEQSEAPQAQHANALLMAAAPRLLEAVKAAHKLMNDPMSDDRDAARVFDLLLTAIDNATGGAA